ncbi:hypothetical protein SEA_MODRAGONS_95 [Mycobacterium phage Modragons]|uniref:Uncharacterized protein n=1 Tax=Mycobacterium phage Ochi17 TaxID=2502425 RepID=A0A411BTL1_9CAUD|nr:hypothetical protein PBI_LLAMA_97 [Mycobacterium phage Llama]YP_010101110.1 hypothetical protein KNU45_gp096 [Mycobacterium phage Ochi17]QFP96476.1 hypothetical protein SEA_MODRAGONS_95 [Mycobacterium phage Modragons]QOP67181.1 hypothetical protein SEA_SEABASTIAN_98 [Mycobacterium phage Seabastian]QOP67292.1 hypothetical protein SEA_OFULTRON_98 [Mycobacterium phage OfUltron]WNM64903.1 hypothetical protein SEA_ALPINESIX_89 [Mycobacterium phage AlpineSix]AIM51039.1 hypothetical protein PBI_L
MSLEGVENTRMIRTEHGWTPEPELDPDWPDLVKLRWNAALVRDETGLSVTVHEANYSIGGVQQTGWYSVHLRYGMTFVSLCRALLRLGMDISERNQGRRAGGAEPMTLSVILASQARFIHESPVCPACFQPRIEHSTDCKGHHK